MIDLKEVSNRIEEAYGSMESPDFSFVSKLIDLQPNAKLLSELSECFQIQEDTDPNDDVSFGYILEKESTKRILRISMVGPYAVLFRIKGGDSGAVEVVETGSIVGEDEKTILRALDKAGLHLLGRADLEIPVDLNVFNTAPMNVKMYQALFTDTDILPWS